ncbi:MAG TPA: Smr/MutS family protein [Xanthobacteraceae bacterium]|nr:Smr/MutS family protein [Xanthobacteraceae bacterium]
MKRRASNEIAAEAPPAPGRRRLLSEDERALWDSVTKQTKPLRKKARIAVAEGETAAAAARTMKSTKPTASATHPSSVPTPARRPNQPSVPPLAPLGRRERSHLSRGRLEIDARLDLHGMTQARAHRALLHFLQRASGDGLRFVLIVTGKGRTAGPESERGVLRRQVPEWLSLPEFRVFVVGFEQAHIGHGGAGALYVRVRRAR